MALQSERILILRECSMPLINCVEFAWIHTDPSLRCGGKDQVHPAAHSKQFNRDIPHSLRMIPGDFLTALPANNSKDKKRAALAD